MLKLIIVRHGETKHNAAGIIQGQFDSELSVEGEKQISKLAIDLKDEPIGLILSSDLSRCVKTTRAIASFHSDCPIIYDQRLRERHNGVFQGKQREEYHRYIQQNQLKPLDFKPDGGESFMEFHQRCNTVLEDIKDKYSNHFPSEKSILISSHSGVISCFDLLIGNYSINDYEQKTRKIENAAVLKYEI